MSGIYIEPTNDTCSGYYSRHVWRQKLIIPEESYRREGWTSNYWKTHPHLTFPMAFAATPAAKPREPNTPNESDKPTGAADPCRPGGDANACAASKAQKQFTASTGGGKVGKPVYPLGGKRRVITTSNISGKPSSDRDNILFPPDMCARESTWIFVPGSGGDWSVKVGSHGSGSDNGSLVEYTVNFGSSGGKWRCEGPHKTYKGAPGSGSGPSISGSKPVGLKIIVWNTGGNKNHIEVHYNADGTGNSWQKVATSDGAGGCNPMTCPVPVGKDNAHSQDTLRIDKNSGHKFISRECHEITPPGGGGGGAAAPAAPAAAKAPKSSGAASDIGIGIEYAGAGIGEIMILGLLFVGFLLIMRHKKKR